MKECQELIGVTFKDFSLLEQALTHRSFLNENKGKKGLQHNERLEFLGDAVLGLVVTEFLFEKYPSKPEGDLTAFRAALVNTITLSDVASKIGLNKYIRLSRGEAKDTGRARQFILADVFESVVGAIYLDQGYGMAKEFISRNILPLIDDIVKKGLWVDAKSLFQERVQELEGITPQYRVLSQEGPDHDRIFTSGVFIEEKEIAQGKGKSKQEAEQEAARNALEERGWMHF